jgi:ribosomal protein S18 acetylase RimI-like enzyme
MDDRALESELALEAALPVSARLAGAELVDEGDLRRLASGRPYASFNHVFAVRLQADAVERRIEVVSAALRTRGSLPATWWITPSTRPVDLAARLASNGLLPDEPEFGMVIDLESAPATPRVEGVDIAPLEESADLAGWTEVMAAAYGWSDEGKARALVELYHPRPGEAAPWVHVVASRDGRPLAVASLFRVDGHAFVTNVGTVPEARGEGLGSAVTLATLVIARRHGYRVASLTASVMGRSMYTRLGFREECRLERYVAGAGS